MRKTVIHYNVVRDLVFFSKSGIPNGYLPSISGTPKLPGTPEYTDVALLLGYLTWEASWVTHYIDDFITISAPDSTECQDNVKVIQSACEMVWNQTRLQFVGIELALEISLPFKPKPCRNGGSEVC